MGLAASWCGGNAAAPRPPWSQALLSSARAPQIRSEAPWGSQLALSINEDEKLPQQEEKIAAEIFALMARLCELGFRTNPQRCDVGSPYM